MRIGLVIVWLSLGCQTAEPAAAGARDAAGLAESARESPAEAGKHSASRTVGFAAPGPSEQRRALGPLDELSFVERAAYEPSSDFQSIPVPSSTDWLALHREAGQSFEEYRRGSVNRLSARRKTIYLVPIGRVGRAPGPGLAELRRFVQVFFGTTVRVSAPLSVADVERGRRDGQLLVPSIFAALRPRVPADAYAVLALTQEDLYPGEGWNFVFGQATYRERIGVQSLARYFPSFFGESDRGQERRIRRRAYAVLAHEIGHMFGLAHCIHFHCLMNGSNGLGETDRSPLHLCPVCLRKLHLNARFELEDRYRRIAAHLGQQGLVDDAAWHRDRGVKLAKARRSARPPQAGFNR